ncbi:hypothetical protein BH11MYX4_BH11MYX4_27430 [soil metagenome]
MRSRPLVFLLAVLSATTVPACIEAAQDPVTYPAVAVQRGNGTSVVDGWTITVSRAEIALGPFYFCAAASGSSTLCASSVAELQAVSFVDALARSHSPLGTVRGFTGPIQSASYDFGISWFDTQTAATPAPLLPGGHSLHLEGEARKGAQVVTIVADVDVVPQYQGQNAVATAESLLPTKTWGPGSADVTSSATRLEVVLEPAAWLRQLDFDAIAATGRAPFVIAPGMEEHTAVLVGLKNLAPPELRWVSAP